MKRKIAIFFSLILVVSGVTLIFLPSKYFNSIKDFLSNGVTYTNFEKIEETISETAEGIIKTVSNPPPLISKISSPKSYLTQEGVYDWTNISRQNESSLPPFSKSVLLDEIAKARLDDMFNKQYFEHISPEGEGASDIAKDVGYEYISIGENIALGNFGTDEKIVEAWMNSPGHRANILDTKYTEIGIAVGQGVYEGQSTWIGVQIFGRPMALCPEPSKTLKIQIDAYRTTVDILNLQIEDMASELESMPKNNNKQIEEYNQKVGEYNSLVKEIQTQSQNAKSAIETYNKQVKDFNSCISN